MIPLSSAALQKLLSAVRYRLFGAAEQFFPGQPDSHRIVCAQNLMHMMEGAAMILSDAREDGPILDHATRTAAVSHLLIPLNKCLTVLVGRFKEVRLGQISLSGTPAGMKSADEFMAGGFAVVRAVALSILDCIPGIRPGMEMSASSSILRSEAWYLLRSLFDLLGVMLTCRTVGRSHAASQEPNQPPSPSSRAAAEEDIIKMEEILNGCLERFQGELCPSSSPLSLSIEKPWVRASVTSGAVRAALESTRALAAHWLLKMSVTDGGQWGEPEAQQRSDGGSAVLCNWASILTTLHEGMMSDSAATVSHLGSAACVVRRAEQARNVDVGLAEKAEGQRRHDFNPGLNGDNLSSTMAVIERLSLWAVEFASSDLGPQRGIRSQAVVLASCVPLACRNSFCWNMQCGAKQSLPPTGTTTSSTAAGIHTRMALEVCLRRNQQPPSQVCARCMSVAYCSRDCQREAWTRGGHKEECGQQFGNDSGA